MTYQLICKDLNGHELNVIAESDNKRSIEDLKDYYEKNHGHHRIIYEIKEIEYIPPKT